MVESQVNEPQCSETSRVIVIFASTLDNSLLSVNVFDVRTVLRYSPVHGLPSILLKCSSQATLVSVDIILINQATDDTAGLNLTSNQR